MKELWVKKTIWRRHLIEDHEIEMVEAMLTHDKDSYVGIADLWCKNEEFEFDNEEVVLPHEFTIKNPQNKI